MFKKRKNKDRSHLKKKTLTDVVHKEEEPENKPAPEKNGEDTDEDKDDFDGDHVHGSGCEHAGQDGDDGDDDDDGVTINRKKKRERKSLFIENTKAKIRELNQHSFKASGTATMKNNSGAAVEVEKVERDISKPKWVGAKAPANVRIISRFDYQPDLCKDYSDTGYCGYGDSCKFMHDRGDYKSGWQLEKEWEEEQEKKRRKLMGEEVSDEEDYQVSDDDDLPWACLICREDFTNPVVTRCKHYFCEKCALDHYIKSTRCQVCGEQTHGIFNTASRLMQQLEKKKRRREIAQKKKEEDMDLKKQVRGTSEGWQIPG